MRIVFMGTPEFAVPPLVELVNHGYDVAAVYTRPDKPTGRSRFPTSSPVKAAALTYNIPVVQPVSLKSADAAAQLASFQPDAVVVAAYGLILPQAVLDVPPQGCINIHPSLLPRHRGASPVASAILSGDAETGITIMLMDAGMDSGSILAQEKAAILPQDTTGTLTERLSQQSAHLLRRVLEQWVKREITPKPQDNKSATYSSMLTKEEGELDWAQPAPVLWRRVRAFQPWPGAFTRWQGKRLEISEAAPFDGKAEVGEVKALKRDGAAFGVGAGEGILGVLKVQLEGKREMTSEEFLRGQPRIIGARLPS